jgi:hypothetical protein
MPKGTRFAGVEIINKIYSSMEPLAIEDKIQAIMQLQSPRWELVQEQYERMKSDHRITDAEIEGMFGLKPGTPPGNNFRNSSAYRRMVTGIVRVWLRTQ